MSYFRLGPLQVGLHRTVRVPEGQSAAALSPSLGVMQLYRVSDYRQNCPEIWEDSSLFVCLHPQEALWLSFDAPDKNPVAVICGAGGVNALTGEKLDLTLSQGNYLVVPPQPWIDGWKDKDSGNVFQFVATEYWQGKGLTVAEQILGSKSLSGGLGLAVFEVRDRSLLKPQKMVEHSAISCSSTMDFSEESGDSEELSSGFGGQSRGIFIEQGIGKGGAISQKIYPDPHGLDVWKPEPVLVKAIYLVLAVTFQEITGEEAPPPLVVSEHYKGNWFKTHDQDMKDISGSEKFTGLKSVFHDDPKPGEGIEKSS